MIEFKNVVKDYGNDVLGADRLSVRIDQGEFVYVVGPSGAGKTTFIKLMYHEVGATSGEIRVNDYDVSSITNKEVPFLRRELGVVFQDFKLFEKKTVYGNIDIARIVAGGRKRDARIKIGSLLAMLGIQQLHKRYPSQLSGGEKQKVCLARAIVNHPTILLADEPTGNLDPRSSEEIMQLFGLIHRQGTTVIVATHDPESAEGLYDREIRL